MSREPLAGEIIKTPWSDEVILLEVVCTLSSFCHGIFGVVAKTEESFGLSFLNLLWVYQEGREWKLWQDFRQLSRSHYQEIQEICGYCELDKSVYYAVRWQDQDCPTWELEERLFSLEGYIPNQFREY